MGNAVHDYVHSAPAGPRFSNFIAVFFFIVKRIVEYFERDYGTRHRENVITMK